MSALRIGFVFVLLGIVSACGRNPAPKYGGELCYVRNHPGEGLDPVLIRFDNATREVAGLIYEGLVGLEPGTFRPVPLLAESWEFSPDRRTLTFRLRRGVRFQDDPCFPDGRGREVTAEDVKYSWERVAGWKGDTWGYEAFRLIEGAEEFRSGRAGHISGIQVEGPHRLRVRFARPDFAFLYAISGPRGYVVPEEAVEYYGEGFPRHPVGTGPFRIARSAKSFRASSGECTCSFKLVSAPGKSEGTSPLSLLWPSFTKALSSGRAATKALLRVGLWEKGEPSLNLKRRNPERYIVVKYSL